MVNVITVLHLLIYIVTVYTVILSDNASQQYIICDKTLI